MDKITAADPRVGPRHVRQGVRKHHLLHPAHVVPALVTDLLRKARQRFIRASTHDQYLRSSPLRSDPFFQLWAQVAEVARKTVRASPPVYRDEEVDDQDASHTAPLHRPTACQAAVMCDETRDYPENHWAHHKPQMPCGDVDDLEIAIAEYVDWLTSGVERHRRVRRCSDQCPLRSPRPTP